MIGRCTSCGKRRVPVSKVDGGSAGVEWFCNGCMNDMVSGPWSPDNTG